MNTNNIENIDEIEHIRFLANCIANELNPLRIYLFGSFAEGKNTEDSDYDFYVVMPDDNKINGLELASNALRSMRHKMNRSVDVLVHNKKIFKKRSNMPATVDKEVYKKGVIIYEKRH